MMRFVSYAPTVACLSFVAGILFFFVIPLTDFNEKTYFSENALLPGLVKGEFDEEVAAERYLEGLRGEAERYPSNVPFPWIESQLRQIGLEVYTHNFEERSQATHTILSVGQLEVTLFKVALCEGLLCGLILTQR